MAPFLFLVLAAIGPVSVPVITVIALAVGGVLPHTLGDGALYPERPRGFLEDPGMVSRHESCGAAREMRHNRVLVR